MVSWSRVDGKRMDRNVLTNKDVLKITSFDHSNAADYECVENTSEEEFTISITLRGLLISIIQIESLFKSIYF